MPSCEQNRVLPAETIALIVSIIAPQHIAARTSWRIVPQASRFASRILLAMPLAEPKWMLLRTVALWKRRPFAELQRLINRPQVLETFGRRGERYELEVHILRNQAPGHEGELRLHVTIDRGGWLGLFAMSFEVTLAPSPNDRAATTQPRAAPKSLCELKDDAPAADALDHQLAPSQTDSSESATPPPPIAAVST